MNATVLDTNVLLALWLFRDPAVEALRAALDAGLLQAVRSAATDAEFAEVLGRPELFSVAPERQATLLNAWQAASSPVDAIQSAPWVCRDPLDQKFLDLAVSAGASWLITRDRDLLKLNLWEGDKVFLPLLRRRGHFSGKFHYKNGKLAGYSVEKY